MKKTKRARASVLSVVALLAVGAVALSACVPAAAPEQPTPTPYPDDCKRKLNLGTEEWEIVCPPPGSRKIDHNLRREYNDLMEEKATRQARGETVRVIERDVTIEVSTHAAVDAVADFLEERTGNRMSRFKDPGAGGRIGGPVNIELLPAVAEMDGVTQVKYNIPAAPASLMRQSGMPTPTLTAVERVRADQWHDAGVTGSGVQVAVPVRHSTAGGSARPGSE